MIRRTLMPLLLVVTVLLFGCTSQPANLQAKMNQPKTALVRTQDYHVGPSDALNVEVRGQTDLSRIALVRPDGKVTLKLLGDVYVSGMTPMEIDEKLTRMYAEYIVGADVTVSVVGMNSQQIYVWGQVPREGPQPYTGELTIQQAISRAGGTLYRAEPKAIQVTRNNKVWKVNLDDIVIHGKTDQNMYLQPGDIIFVPMNGFARVGFALDNIFFPVRSLFSFVFLGDSIDDLKNKHQW
ncbi:MAG TPA: polysaccharide biosynthesis/export family protein [Planctomycetota bacterium]|nr:polysaccharide biosynthesis/export family protein [Planctomycetota bacterium]